MHLLYSLGLQCRKEILNKLNKYVYLQAHLQHVDTYITILLHLSQFNY